MAKKKSGKDQRSAGSGKAGQHTTKELPSIDGRLADAVRLPTSVTELSQLSTTPLELGPTDKKSAAHALSELGQPLADLQEKLYAQSTAGSSRGVLLLLQGMDTAGKDGVIDHVVGLLNPGGVRMASFKSPNAEELSHDFLWRIEKQLPQAGEIGVFNRSHYEDVLIVRVHDLVPRAEWSKRYAQINAFERHLKKRGVTLIKCFLHISKKTQAERLAARLDDPEKYWKYNPADVDERGHWDDYQQAYLDALRKCNTVGTPWHVIPSDKKWYRNWAVAALLHETLVEIDPQYPAAEFDLEVERKRIAES